MRNSPSVMSSSPAIIRSAVDFPQPDGPTRIMMMMGTVTTTAAAAIEPVGCWNCDAPGNCEIAAGTVCAADVDVSDTAKMKSFHAKMKTRIIVVNTPGAASGAITLVKAWNGVAPSIWAACSSSHGISLKNADSV